jgi:hypothetical protein
MKNAISSIMVIAILLVGVGAVYISQHQETPAQAVLSALSAQITPTPMSESMPITTPTPGPLTRQEIDPDDITSYNVFFEALDEVKETSKETALSNIPVYDEEELFFKTDGSFYINRDACFYDNQNARQNDVRGILLRYPTQAIRERDSDSFYTVYDTDTEYRLFLFFGSQNNYTTPMGFPVVIKDMLSYSDFSELAIGDPIEDVEVIDTVATVHKNLIINVFQMDPIGSASFAADGYPCTSIHYLTDGILKIEYEMLENRDLIISDIEFSEDYRLTNARGNIIDYKILDIDLPTGE